MHMPAPPPGEVHCIAHLAATTVLPASEGRISVQVMVPSASRVGAPSPSVRDVISSLLIGDTHSPAERAARGHEDQARRQVGRGEFCLLEKRIVQWERCVVGCSRRGVCNTTRDWGLHGAPVWMFSGTKKMACGSGRSTRLLSGTLSKRFCVCCSTWPVSIP